MTIITRLEDSSNRSMRDSNWERVTSQFLPNVEASGSELEIGIRSRRG